MTDNKLLNIMSLDLAEGQEGPPDLLDDETRSMIDSARENNAADTSDQASAKSRRYVPANPGQPWKDFHVQNGARRFLKEVVLPDWRRNHPHKTCSNIRVDEWGRVLCRYITPTSIGVDGPWENPTHFLFYAYNSFQTQQKYGTRLTSFLRDFCNIDLP